MRVRRMSQIIGIATLAGVGVLVPASTAVAAHPAPTAKEDCRGGEFAEYRTGLAANAPQRFKNQGQCIRFVVTGKG